MFYYRNENIYGLYNIEKRKKEIKYKKEKEKRNYKESALVLSKLLPE
jgi:hypothetical protein